MSNIALQIFTKLGGIPWKVKPAYDNCLIIGIGQAHRLGVAGIQKYFAYCVATDSSGLYKKIAVLSHTNLRATYIDDLQRSLVREMLVNGFIRLHALGNTHVPLSERTRTGGARKGCSVGFSDSGFGQVCRAEDK